VLIGNVFGQSNLYWQNGYYPKNVRTVLSVSETKHYFLYNLKRIQLTSDNFKTSQDVNSHYVSGFEGLLFEEYAVFRSSSDHLVRYDFRTGVNEVIGPSTANKFLKYNQYLLYYQDEGGDIYSSCDEGFTWEFVKNTQIIKSWGTSGKGFIYCSDHNNDIYRVDSLFGDKTVILPNASLSYSDYFYTAGRDTVYFPTDSKLYRSFDKGNSFTIKDFGRIDHGIKADNYGNLYMLLKNSLIRSADRGETWEEIFYKVGYGGFFYINDKTIHVSYADYHSVFNDPEVSSPEYDNYFPLEVGNKWFYQATSGRYGFKTIEVYDSTRIEGIKYFKVTDFEYPLRYENNMLLFYKDGADSLYMDFNTPSGQKVYYRPEARDYAMLEGEYEIFDTNVYNKGPYYSYGVERVGALFSPGIGEIFRTSYEIFWQDIVNYDTVLVQSVINSDDGVFEYNDVPPPLFSGIVEILHEEEHFKISTDVVHEMSKITNYIDINMVDTVRLEYFYSNGNANQSAGNVIGERQPHQVIYSFKVPIENQLIQNGYLLHFKFNAFSKGVIPVYNIYPTEGYLVTNGNLINLDSEPKDVRKFFLRNNYPNPFNPSTNISYSLAKPSFVTLEVFNIQGERVKIVIDKQQSAGEYNAEFDGLNLTSGVYIARLRAVSQTGGEIFTRSIKMILMK